MEHTFQDFTEYLDGIELYRNSILEYAISLSTFLLVITVGYLIKHSLLKSLRTWINPSMSKRKRFTINSTRSWLNKFFTWPLIVAIAIYLSSRSLEMANYLRLTITSLTLMVILGTIIFSLFRLTNRIVMYRKSRSEPETYHVTEFMGLTSKILITGVTVVLFFSTLGINLTAVVTAMGIGGVIIAFAVQNIVADLFAAITIYIDRPFELGDRVKIQGETGHIERIGIRSTHVRSLEGHLLVFNNQTLTSEKIENHQKRPEIRCDQILGVAAETPLDYLDKIPVWIENLMKDIEKIRFERMNLIEIGDFSWNYRLIYHVRTSSIKEYEAKLNEINIKILKRMEKENIEIPYPKYQLLLDSVDNQLEIKLQGKELS